MPYLQSIKSSKRQTEKADLEAQLAQETMTRPVLTVEEVRFFFDRFKNGNAIDNAFRSSLIDTFVNKIILYDGDDSRIEIYCNASDKPYVARLAQNNCATHEPINSSCMAQLAPQVGLEPTTLRLTAACSGKRKDRLRRMSILESACNY